MELREQILLAVIGNFNDVVTKLGSGGTDEDYEMLFGCTMEEFNNLPVDECQKVANKVTAKMCVDLTNAIYEEFNERI